MAVEVLIRRKLVVEKVDRITPLMIKLRSLAHEQPGYICSESLRCIDPADENDYLIRSTWHAIEDWKHWLHSDERAALQKQIDAISGVETEYRVYEPLVGGIGSGAGQ